jgi:hypothetical protein
MVRIKLTNADYFLVLATALATVIALACTIGTHRSKLLNGKIREVHVYGALDKEKSFDAKEKRFNFDLAVTIESDSLFKFNDHIQDIKDQFYYLLVETKGNLSARDEGVIASRITKRLTEFGIYIEDINVRIQPVLTP